MKTVVELLVWNDLLTGYLDEMQEKRVEMEMEMEMEMEKGTRSCKAH